MIGAESIPRFRDDVLSSYLRMSSRDKHSFSNDGSTIIRYVSFAKTRTKRKLTQQIHVLSWASIMVKSEFRTTITIEQILYQQIERLRNSKR